MNKIKFLVRASFFLGIVFLMPSLAEAQAAQTWVSGVGSDANPCSRTAPCLTFAGAFVKTNIGGAISCLDPGNFGAVTITYSVTIDCRGVTAGSLPGGGTSITINTADSARTVRLKGLDLNGTAGSTNGIRIVNAAKVDIEDSTIDGFASNGISVENTTDISVSISNTKIRNNGLYAINVFPASNTLNTSIAVNNVNLTKNNSGIINDRKAKVVISNSQVTYNIAYGLYALDSEMTVVNCTVSHNNIGVQSDNLASIKITGNTVTNNTIGLRPNLGSITSFKNNSVLGNGMDGAPTISVNQQ